MTRLPLAGASNFRDFGGHALEDGSRIKPGLLFRSDALGALTEADFDHLAPIGIRTIFDLRRPGEAEAAPTRWRGAPAPEIRNTPVIGEDGGPSTFQRIMLDPQARQDPERAAGVMRALYRDMMLADGAKAAYRAIFGGLARAPGAPIVVHCTAGKDRTGVVCALILEVLGASRATIMADFLLSRDYYDGAARFEAYAAQALALAEIADWRREALARVFTVSEDYLDAALEILDQDHGGSAEAFLIDAGVAPADLAAIRAAYRHAG